MSDELKQLFWKVQKHHYNSIQDIHPDIFNESHGDWLEFRKQLFKEMDWTK